jgi:hypothetical protein
MRRIRNGGVLALFTLGAWLAASPQAYGDHIRVGNGSGNHNALSIRSPTRNSGVQAISNSNAGGVSSSRNALCKKVRVCRIHQAAWDLP